MNIAQLHEAIAAAIPDYPCILFREQRFSWQQVTDRTRRLATLFKQHGLGCFKERSDLNNWESGQDHVGLYLYNGNEYLEGILGCFKSRTAPFNVNYRYVEDELLYLFDNADAKAVIFHARFADRIAGIKPRLPKVRLWLQVSDDSHAPLIDGALDYEKALDSVTPEAPGNDLSGDDLYVVYTGGTTGMPKGVLWRQEDLFYSSLIKGNQRTSIDEIVADIAAHHKDKPAPVGLPSPPLMHATAQWIAMSLWVMGGTVVIQSHPESLDADDIWRCVERHKVNSLTIVGDAFALPLLKQLDKQHYDLSSLRLLASGGAILSPANKESLLAKLPQVTLLDALGSSETGTQASQLLKKGQKVTTGDFAQKEGSVVLKEDLSGLMSPGSEQCGWAARAGYVPLGYYKDEAKTRKTFPVIAGTRYAVPGDRAYCLLDGSMKLLGRDSVTINTGGEKVFAEEVEQALKHHPAIFDVVVVGTVSERWGQQVTALVQICPDAVADQRQLEQEFRATVKQHLAGYKVPKVFCFIDKIVRAPSGKPDYRWAKATAERLVAPPVTMTG